MRKTFKYRIYPTKAQRKAMQKALDACRWIYNKALATRKDAWKQEQHLVTLYDTIKMLPEWKREHPFLLDAYSQSLQDACTRVDLAFQAFFRRVKSGQKPGYPRFKGNWYKSFTYPQSGFRLLDNGRLRLSKIGDVKINFHRPIVGKVKTLTVHRDTLGNWFVCFSCEVEPNPLPLSPKVVGVDVGLTHFATLSTGEYIPNPRFFRKDEKALAKAQRRLSKCTKSTPEYRKYKRVFQHIHQRIANRRKDFAHKLSRRLINEFQIIVFENLNIQDMQNGNWRSMNKSIGDAAWRMLMDFTAYKAGYAGRLSPRIDPRGTTQTCSGCGQIVPKDLSVRVHECPHCGLVLDRDVNAALNILALGLHGVGSIPRSLSLQRGNSHNLVKTVLQPNSVDKPTKPCYTKTMSNINWPEYEHLLGQLSDPALARLIGCHANTVAYQRNARRIPAANKATAPLDPVKRQFVLDEGLVERIEEVDALRRAQLGGGNTNYSLVVRRALEHGLPLLRAELQN